MRSTLKALPAAALLALASHAATAGDTPVVNPAPENFGQSSSVLNALPAGTIANSVAGLSVAGFAPGDLVAARDAVTRILQRRNLAQADQAALEQLLSDLNEAIAAAGL